MDAWLADEVGEERLTGVYLRGAQVGRAFTVAGIAASVGLALADVRLPIVLGIFVARQVSGPLFTAWLNRSIDDPSVRATTLSIVNQADAVGQWTGGPAIGALGTVTSIRVALVGATACLLPALAFLRRASRLDARAQVGEAAVTNAD